MMFGINYYPLPNTTLNEKFNVLEHSQFEYITNENYRYPTISGVVIGRGGKEVVNSNLLNLKVGKHSPLDAALYEHIPFIIRPVSDDLISETRKNYRLRVEENIKGTRYALYYMKKLDMSNIWYRPEILYIDYSEVIPSAKILNTYRDDILSPKPDKNNDLVNLENTKFAVNVIRVPFQLDKDELEELYNVKNILELEDTLITEIGFCTGIDYELPDGSLESVFTQVGFFIDVNLDLQVLDSPNIKFDVELGGGELIPLRKEDESSKNCQ